MDRALVSRYNFTVGIDGLYGDVCYGPCRHCCRNPEQLELAGRGDCWRLIESFRPCEGSAIREPPQEFRSAGSIEQVSAANTVEIRRAAEAAGGIDVAGTIYR